VIDAPEAPVEVGLQNTWGGTACHCASLQRNAIPLDAFSPFGVWGVLPCWREEHACDEDLILFALTPVAPVRASFLVMGPSPHT